MTVEFRLLGDVAMYAGGQSVDIGHARQRCVLAALLVDANRVVPVTTLADRVWAGRHPRSARNALSGYVSRLRRLVTSTGGARLVRQPGGYLLTVDPLAVDLHRFRHLTALARSAPDGTEALTLLAEALRLWRGDAFATLDTPWLNGIRDALDAERLAAELDRNDLALDRGRHSSLLPELTARAATHALDERLAAQLMLALYRNGRQADALRHYEQLRLRLAEELGADPCPPVRQLHQRILAADPALTPTTGAGGLVPRQLPAPPAAFTGRAAELDRLDAILPADASSTVDIAVVSGTAGVGKTALALHWAHRVAPRFPDGQLYVNLRGFDPTGSVLDPAEAIRGFLDAFAVPPPSIPAGLDAQTGLYRSLLAGKRALVVLDNARDVEQVRPLLPGTPGCLVLVTSRNRLTGLIADHGAHPLTLDLLSHTEARDLLAARAGAHRIAEEPAAANEIITRCARLPLALTITAARAATHPAFPLAGLAAELTSAGPLADLRAVFSWSYRTLSPAAARLFRLLGLHVGPELSAPAAGSLTGLPVAEVRPLLTELADAHLVTEHTPGRFTMHDLLYAYAIELTQAHDSGAERHRATNRMLEHYLHTAQVADRLLQPEGRPIRLTPTQAGVTPQHLADHEQAMSWLAAQHPALVEAVRRAEDAGVATQVSWTVATFFDRRSHWHTWAATGDYDEAHTHLCRALELFQARGDHAGRARTLLALDWIFGRQARFTEAVAYARQAYELYREIGDQLGQAKALNSIGWAGAQLADPAALDSCRQAVALHQLVGDQYGEAASWDSLGYAHHRLGAAAEALTCYRRALELHRTVGHRYDEAYVLVHIGEVHAATGEDRLAAETWQVALAILTELDHPDAQALRARLPGRDRAEIAVLGG
ncbi:MAG TPA: BTAD domain-containing putative transcriptional regulator [Actinophytocola sp.]|jgi:DNA-binding SARP family transcriptional activator/tetratricopeptide (TPR) repeat protein|uniref:AfsR/SARP family transcriptional regulator n=1 Tax=Actinophytocola sp. TaxID=1872138 RepID=UPI002DFCA3C3|nr:BTAD domain-containing putative transcriptional regulator [Actinophytocola sp.]